MKLIEDIKLKRKELKLKVDDIAKRLHLSKSIIQLIEDEKFDEFEDKVYVYGYIIRYLKILNLSYEEYKQELDSIIKIKLDTPVIGEKKNGKLNYYFYGVVLLIILILISFHFYSEKNEKVEIIPPTETKIGKPKLQKQSFIVSALKKCNIKYQNDTNPVELKTLNKSDTIEIGFFNNLKVKLSNLEYVNVTLNDTKLNFSKLPTKSKIALEFFYDTSTNSINRRTINFK